MRLTSRTFAGSTGAASGPVPQMRSARTTRRRRYRRRSTTRGRRVLLWSLLVVVHDVPQQAGRGGDQPVAVPGVPAAQVVALATHLADADRDCLVVLGAGQGFGQERNDGR